MYELVDDHPQIEDFLAADGQTVLLDVGHEPAGNARLTCRRSKGKVLLDLDVSRSVYEELA